MRREFARCLLRRATVDVPASEAVVVRAQRFQQAGLAPLDAVHLASAIEAGAAFFCTTDSALLRRSRRVNTGTTRVVSPLDLVAALDP